MKAHSGEGGGRTGATHRDRSHAKSQIGRSIVTGSFVIAIVLLLVLVLCVVLLRARSPGHRSSPRRGEPLEGPPDGYQLIGRFPQRTVRTENTNRGGPITGRVWWLR